MALLPELVNLVYDYLIEEKEINENGKYEKYTEISGVKHGKYYQRTNVYETTSNYYLGKLHGSYIEQSLINKHRIECFYLNNQFHGVYRSYNYDGVLCGRTEYKYGKEEGVSMGYYSDGRIHTISEMKNGMLDGVNKRYDLNGDLVEYSEYKEYKRHGVWKTFYDGVEDTSYFKNGKRMWCSFM